MAIAMEGRRCRRVGSRGEIQGRRVNICIGREISDQLYSQYVRECHRMLIIAAVLVGLLDGDNNLLLGRSLRDIPQELISSRTLCNCQFRDRTKWARERWFSPFSSNY